MVRLTLDRDHGSVCFQTQFLTKCVTRVRVLGITEQGLVSLLGVPWGYLSSKRSPMMPPCRTVGRKIVCAYMHLAGSSSPCFSTSWAPEQSQTPSEARSQEDLPRVRGCSCRRLGFEFGICYLLAV